MEQTLHSLVHESCTDHPSHVAVLFDDGYEKHTLTYQELLGCTSKLQTYFADYLSPSDVIGLCLKSDLYMPPILISILRCQCAFYNMDIESAEFACQVVEDIGIRYILLHKEYTKVFKKALSSKHSLTEMPQCYLDTYIMYRIESIPIRAHAPDMAYYITTSGTTGKPKVVQVPHRCIVPNITHLRQMFNISTKDTVLMASPLTFDPSIVEMFMTLTSGACLLVIPRAVHLTPDLLLHTVYERNRVTIMQITPTLLTRFAADKLPLTLLGDHTSLRILALGGEQFPSPSFLRKIKLPSNTTRLYNLYGTTEVSCWATCCEVKLENYGTEDVVAIGDCLQDTYLEVRDTDGNVLSCGKGELFIGGCQRQCILSTDETGSDDINVLKMRGTGDIVEKRSDGHIYYLHRVDRQVKLNGKRINLEEIKEVACQLGGIHQCEVLLLSNQIVLFVVQDSNDATKYTDKMALTEIPTDGSYKYNLNKSKGSVTENAIVNTATETDKNESTESKVETESFTQVPCIHVKDRVPSHKTENTIDNHEMETDKRKNAHSAAKVVTFTKVPFTSMVGCKKVLSAFEIHRHLEPFCTQPSAYDKDRTPNPVPVKAGTTLTEAEVIRRRLTSKLPHHSLPDIVIQVHNLPMTKHGKVDMKKLEQIYKNKIQRKQDLAPLDCLRHTWMNLLDVDSCIEIEDHINFINAGGNSLKALHLMNELESCLGTSLPDLLDIILQKSFKDVKQYILKEQKLTNSDINCKGDKSTIPKITSENKDTDFSDENIVTHIMSDNIDTVSVEDSKFKRKHLEDTFQENKAMRYGNGFYATIGRASKLIRSDKDTRKDNSDISDVGALVKETAEESNIRLTLHETWKYDTRKCVDASPQLALTMSPKESIVYIGSHSHIMCALRLETGEQLWETTLPDRIESSACLTSCGRYVVVGCYDNKVYCLHGNNGDIWWSYDTGGQVKSSPTVDEQTGHIYIGSHSQSLLCLSVDERRVVWRACLHSGSIFSSPCVWYTPHSVYVGTLGGQVFSIDATTGDVGWQVCLGKPVFSSMAVCGAGVCIGCTDNRVCLYTHQGQQVWSFDTNGPIFSSPVIFKHYNDDHFKTVSPLSSNSLSKEDQKECRTESSCHSDCQEFVAVGCHDNHVYCLTLKGELVWKVKANSMVYSSPFMYTINVDVGPKSDRRNCECEFDMKDSSQMECSVCNCAQFGDCTNKCSQIHNLEVKENENFVFYNTEKYANISNMECNKDVSAYENYRHLHPSGSEASKCKTYYAESTCCDISNNSKNKTKYTDMDPIENQCIKCKSKEGQFTNTKDAEAISSISNIPQTVITDNRLMSLINRPLPVIVFCSSTGTVYVAHAVTGKILCEKNLPYEIFSSPVVHNNSIIIGCRDNFVYSLCVKAE